MRLFVCWILLAVVLIAASGVPPVNRTQEARVLETAREMIGRPSGDWLIPKLNGNVRLRKPPLAYWASAVSMSMFGETERAGRLPTVLLSWLSVGATFAIARRWFNRRVAVLAAGALAGSWLFLKHGMLAETDAYAATGMTLGVYAIVRASESPRGRDILWLHVVAVCFAGIILAKGPPAAYLLLFWMGWCWIHRDWRTLIRFISRGAILTLLILAVPWFLYVKIHTAADGQLGADFANSADGGDHPGPPWAYVPLLIKATLPWTGVWIVALAMAGTGLWKQFRSRPPSASSRSRRSNALLNLAIWGAAVLLPLCVWGNKQFHYLLPVMPPTMILAGWVLDAATRGGRHGRAARVTLGVTAVLLSLSPVAVLVTAVKLRPGVTWPDFALIGVLLLTVAVVAREGFDRRGPRPAARAVLVLALLVMLAVHAWLPAVLGGRSRLASQELVNAYPNGRFVFRATELPVMSWSMRRAVPTMDDTGITAASGDADLVVIDQQQDGEKAPVQPSGFIESRTIRQGDNTLHVYVPGPLSHVPMGGR